MHPTALTYDCFALLHAPGAAARQQPAINRHGSTATKVHCHYGTAARLSLSVCCAGGQPAAAAAAAVQMPTADDPSANPVLLPPRTRADVVQDRPAGGSAEEVAAANPALAAAVPATVGKADEPGAGADALLEAADLLEAAGGATAGGQGATGNAGGRRQEDAAADEGAGAGAGAGVGGAVDMSDGSGMEFPELAVQEGWTR
jgi:hypothetical protein